MLAIACNHHHKVLCSTGRLQRLHHAAAYAKPSARHVVCRYMLHTGIRMMPCNRNVWCYAQTRHCMHGSGRYIMATTLFSSYASASKYGPPYYTISRGTTATQTLLTRSRCCVFKTRLPAMLSVTVMWSTAHSAAPRPHTSRHDRHETSL